jgi:hypothetical protein
MVLGKVLGGVLLGSLGLMFLRPKKAAGSSSEPGVTPPAVVAVNATQVGRPDLIRSAAGFMPVSSLGSPIDAEALRSVATRQEERLRNVVLPPRTGLFEPGTDTGASGAFRGQKASAALEDLVAMLLTLQGDSTALLAWSQAFTQAGFNGYAGQFLAKAQGQPVSPVRGGASAPPVPTPSPLPPPSGTPVPPAGVPPEVIAAMAQALASGDVAAIRALAVQLRNLGFTTQATELERAAGEIEAQRKGQPPAAASPPPVVSPGPPPAAPPPVVSPSPGPVAPTAGLRTVLVPPGAGLAQVARSLGRPETAQSAAELRAVNVPFSADGKARRSVDLKSGGLDPALDRGDRLFVPASWGAVGDPPSGARAASPVVTPASPPVGPSPALALAIATNDMMMRAGIPSKGRGKEDQELVRRFQTQERLGATDGKYGVDTGLALADRYGLIPQRPYYYSKTNANAQKARWKASMARHAQEDPTRVALWVAAGKVDAD